MSAEVLQAGGYTVDIVVQGFPGKTVCHGGLGWSTVALIRGSSRTAIVDTGGFGYRPLLIKRLSERGLKPGHVTDLLITHAHHDHCLNWPLFKEARIVIGRQEMAWALRQPWGETPVPELYVRELQGWPSARQVDDGEEVMPGVTAHMAPGHTPGHLAFVLHGSERDVIFAGDSPRTGPSSSPAPPMPATTARSPPPPSRGSGHSGAAGRATSWCPDMICRWCRRTDGQLISPGARPRSRPGTATTSRPSPPSH